MALSEGYRSALSSIGPQGGGLVGALSSGLSAGAQYAAGALETAAERRRKKQEEERAREREGLTFALNKAIEDGNAEQIRTLLPKVYPGVQDVEAVALGAQRKKQEADFKSLIEQIPSAADETSRTLLGRRAGELGATLFGLPKTVKISTGKMIESGRYEDVPALPGYAVGAIIPESEAKALAARGLGGSLKKGATPNERIVKTEIPAVAASQRPIMVEETIDQPLMFGEKADTAIQRRAIDAVRRRAETVRAEITKQFLEISDEDRPKFEAKKRELEEAVNNWETTAVINKGVTDDDFPLPTVSFAGATTYKGQQIGIRRQTAADRAAYQRGRLAQLSRGLNLSERRIGVYAQSVANNYTLGKERNVIAASNVDVRRDHLNAFIESKNNEQSLKDWAATADAQAKTDQLILDSRKAAVDAVRKTPAFSDAARKEAVAAGQGDAFDTDYKNAVAAEEGRLVQIGLRRLAPAPTRKDIKQPERAGAPAPVVRAAPANPPARVPANSSKKPKGLGASRDIE